MSVPFERRAFHTSLILSSVLMLVGVVGLLWVHLAHVEAPPRRVFTATVLAGAIVEIAAVWLVCRR
jgi:hypothetical protein